MGYYSTRRKKSEAERHLGPVELICIVVAVGAVLGLLAWIALNAGGGHNLI